MIPYFFFQINYFHLEDVFFVLINNFQINHTQNVPKRTKHITAQNPHLDQSGLGVVEALGHLEGGIASVGSLLVALLQSSFHLGLIVIDRQFVDDGLFLDLALLVHEAGLLQHTLGEALGLVIGSSELTLLQLDWGVRGDSSGFDTFSGVSFGLLLLIDGQGLWETRMFSRAVNLFLRK